MSVPAPTEPDRSAEGDGVVVGEDGRARPAWANADPLLREYYDTEWGMPVRAETGMYERITLEAFQAGLSWATILRKRPTFRAAFEGFEPERVARYQDPKIEELMANAGIVRNRAKILAAITNASATIRLRERGGLADFVWSFQPAEIPAKSPESIALAKALRKEGFVFVGPTTMYALMEAVGIIDTHLVGSHRRGSSGIWPA